MPADPALGSALARLESRWGSAAVRVGLGSTGASPTLVDGALALAPAEADPDQETSPAALPDEIAPLASARSDGAPGAEDAAPRLVVHVVGAVRRAGLFRLPEGARVADALARAGGPIPKADVSAVNLAAPLVDGQQVIAPAETFDLLRAFAPVRPAPDTSVLEPLTDRERELFALAARTRAPLTHDIVALGRVCHWGETTRARAELLPELICPTLSTGLRLCR